MTEGAFVQDLAVLMAVAGLVAGIFSRLQWPKVIGYLFAGIVMSGHTWGGSFLKDAGSVQIIGQLGVVFLMFGMGLSFSPTKMRKVRSVALPSAVFDTVMMIWLGYLIGTRVFGWAPAQSFFLGVAICDSATTLLAKVIDEMKWGGRSFTKYVLGTSVCEDIICVGAIAVATGLMNGGGLSAGAFVFSLAGLGVFFLSVLVLGLVFVPRLLSSAGKTGDDESLLLVLLGCCFFVSYFAYRFDYSLALGAFLVGIVGGSSPVHDRLERLVDPLKSMFSAVFFVSIGLLIDPAEMWNNAPEILLVSAVVVCGKFLNNFIASLASGLDVKTSVQNGMGLAQVGEFAFMVAVLYAGLVGDSDSRMFQIAVGASFLTTLANPWLLRLSDKAGDLAERAVPRSVRRWLEAYHAWVEKLRASEGSPKFSMLRSEFILLAVCAVLLLAVSTVCAQLHRFDYSRFSGFFERNDEIFFFFAANLFSVVLLPLIITAARKLGEVVADLLIGEDFVRSLPLRQFVRFISMAVVVALYFMEWAMINVTIAPGRKWAVVVLAVIALTAVAGWRFFVKASRRATQRFHEALSAAERRESLARTMTITVPEGAIHKFTLEPSSPAIGGTVVTLNVRAKTGASIVSVVRDGKVMRNPCPDLEFCVGDTLVAIGEPRQIAALKDMLGVTG